MTVVMSDIELQEVYFFYPSWPEKAILQGLSLSIPAGKTIALVGSSGYEKSAVISLVEHVNVSKGGPLMARPIAIGKLKSRV
ncbi:hypothetical protein JHK87_006536 [Glycine soja]|nr:hypothetical protein JHK87_006536 [Glycine soja]